MKSLIKFKAFVDKILASNSRIYKEDILEEYKDDTDIRFYLNFIYNPYIVTGISNKKLNKTLNTNMQIVVPNTAFEMLNYLKDNNTGRDVDITTLLKYEYTLEDGELVNLFDRIVTKNLPLGISAKTINKYMSGLIPEFNVMLANKYFDKPEIVEGKEFVITTKIDGSRIIAIKDNGLVSFYTRQGQLYEGLVDLEAEMLSLMPDNIVLDGELVAIDTVLEDTYKNTMKLSRTKDNEKHGLKMKVFDAMPVSDFKNQKSTMSYNERRAVIEFVFNKPKKNIDYESDTTAEENNQFKYFELVPSLYKGSDTTKIIELLDEQTAKGEEGIMINICDSPYIFNRSNSLLKVKKFQDTEVKVIGFEAGTNKLSNTLGALVCEYKGNTVRVGSGFSDDLRSEIWANKDSWLDKIITVKYFEETYDSKTKLPSLRFPIFLRIREDN